jgi:hypothetical protein
MGMKRVILLLTVIGVCMGCSSAQSSAPDYEITSEKDKDISNLKTKTLNVSTEFTKEQKLRQIARDIKGDYSSYDALSIQFHKGTQGDGATKETGAGIVVNNQEAAEKMLPDLLFTDADRRELLKEDDGILVITQADIKQVEKEMQKATRELQKDLKQDSKSLDKKVDRGMNKMDKEVQELQEGMDQELKELEKEMEKEMPKP